MAGWRLDWFGLFEKGGFDSCINISDGFNGHNHHMKAALGLSLLASLHGWRQWYLASVF